LAEARFVFKSYNSKVFCRKPVTFANIDSEVGVMRVNLYRRIVGASWMCCSGCHQGADGGGLQYDIHIL
jgi:hypothetical protein